MVFLKLKLKSYVIKKIEITRLTIFFILVLIEVTYKRLQEMVFMKLKLIIYVIKNIEIIHLKIFSIVVVIELT